MQNTADLSYLAEAWPHDIVPRLKIGEFTQGLMMPKTISNLDSRKKGPKGRFKIGRQVWYRVGPLIEWLEGRTKCIDLTAQTH